MTDIEKDHWELTDEHLKDWIEFVAECDADLRKEAVMTEIRIAISPETLALLEMSMTEGDTYDAVIMRLMKTPWKINAEGNARDGEKIWFTTASNADFRLPEGLSIDPGAITKMQVIDRVAEETRVRLANLAKAALAVRDDISRTVHLPTFHELNAITCPVKSDAISVIINTNNILALDSAVKAVFDE